MDNGDNMDFQSFLRRGSNYTGGEPEVFEDTHDANGRYIGGRPVYDMAAPHTYDNVPPAGAFGGAPSFTPPPSVSGAMERTERTLAGPAHISGYGSAPSPQSNGPVSLPDEKSTISPQLNSKFVIYRPRTTAEVEKLIAFLRRREPALVDLDPVAGTAEGQRIMDFIAGGAYALGETVMTVRPNLFLITPDTMDVYKPESDTDQ